MAENRSGKCGEFEGTPSLFFAVVELAFPEYAITQLGTVKCTGIKFTILKMAFQELVIREPDIQEMTIGQPERFRFCWPVEILECHPGERGLLLNQLFKLHLGGNRFHGFTG